MTDSEFHDAVERQSKIIKQVMMRAMFPELKQKANMLIMDDAFDNQINGREPQLANATQPTSINGREPGLSISKGKTFYVGSADHPELHGGMWELIYNTQYVSVWSNRVEGFFAVGAIRSFPSNLVQPSSKEFAIISHAAVNQSRIGIVDLVLDISHMLEGRHLQSLTLKQMVSAFLDISDSQSPALSVIERSDGVRFLVMEADHE